MILDNSRISFVIGISELCNLKCAYCPQSDTVYEFKDVRPEIYNREKRFMSFDIFDKCMENLDGNFDELNFAGFGEPMLNPDFIKIFEKAVLNSNRFKSIYVYTNATKLDQKMCENILDIMEKSVCDVYFVFSVGAYSEDTYSLLKGKDLYKKVKNNVESFIKRSNKKDIKKLYSIVQFVIVKENQKDLPEFKKYWEGFFDLNRISYEYEKFPGERLNDLSRVGLDFIEALSPNQKSSNKLYINTLKENDLEFILEDPVDKSVLYVDHMTKSSFSERKPCSALFRQPLIGADGKLCVCCRDITSSASYGDLSKNRFSEIFYNDKSRKWRISHLTGEFKEPELCFDCTGFEMETVEMDEIRKYLESIGKKELYYIHRNKMEKGYRFDFADVCIKNISVFEDFLKKNNLDHVVTEKVSGLTHKSCIEFSEYKNVQNLDNTLLPCSKWFEYVVFEDKIYSGCEKIKLDYEKIIRNKHKILVGDYTSLPEECVNCYKRYIPTKDLFIREKENINNLWKQFIMEPEFFLRQMPDFNNIEFDEDFKRTTASGFRESYIRFILKYDKNPESLLKIYEYINDCGDIYLYILLFRYFMFNGLINESENIILKILESNPSEYFKKVYEIYLKMKKGEKVSFLEFEKSDIIEQDYLLMWSLREYIEKNGLWE